MITAVYLSLGSNLGDRRRFIRQAVSRLSQLGATRVSEEYANSADGFKSDNRFINVAVELKIETESTFTEADALALLHRCQAIESELSSVPHRNSDGSYRDREIDIDIIAVEGLQMESAELTLPHPRAEERAFVTVPLSLLTGEERARMLLGQ